MGLFSAHRHHLQNKVNRQIIADRRAQRTAERDEARKAEKHATTNARAFAQTMAEIDVKIAHMTQDERVAGLEHAAESAAYRGDTNSPAQYRAAAEVVRRMTSDEYAEHVQARLRNDPSTSVAALARRAIK